MIRLKSAGALILVVLFSASFALADDPPQWLRTVAGMAVPAQKEDVRGVVLLDEGTITVNETGELKKEQKYAVRISSRDGKGLAIAREFYLASAGKVEELKAWVITPEGKSIDFGKKDIIDVISDSDDIYNEYRIKSINASGSVDKGYTFGYTSTLKENALFFQDVWRFQSSLPVVNSRYTLNLPPGWTATSTTFNHAEIAPNQSGNSYTWELKDLPAVSDEPMSPSLTNIVPWIAVNFAPAGESSGSNRVFSNWTDVSEWATKMYDPQVIVDDEVAAKARELTANSKTELEKIKAIGTFVQNLQYISVDIGVAYGNGYRPRPSNLVLQRGYGDCKDKANLMRALLRAVKIESYPIAIYSGDPTYVKKKWASPRQFNHAIIAVRVSPETKTETIIENEKLGRLMIFDATDDMTPVGDLPEYLQGSYALVMAGKVGDLLEMPNTSPEFNAFVRTLDVKLNEYGGISGKIKESSRGQSSKYERAQYRSNSRFDYQKLIERWLNRGATAAKLGDFTATDDHLNATFNLDLSFEVPAYGQVMQDRLLTFRPVIVSRMSSVYLTDPKRSLPIELSGSSVSEVSTFELPKGFVVDEMPEALNLKTPFADYTSNYLVENGKLIFKREMKIKRGVIPAGRYSEVRRFFGDILNAEKTPVVLIRK